MKIDHAWALELVKSPPCSNCKHFKPKVTYPHFGREDFTICHAEEMHSDFSCYEEIDIGKD